MVYVDRAPSSRLNEAYSFLFDQHALSFLNDFVTSFENDFDKIVLQRQQHALSISEGLFKPVFKNTHTSNNWKINELPKRLRNRKLDLGDCSPANTFHLIDTLNADVQGIQVDFDDGFCPTWFNTIQGLYNVCLASRSKLNGMLNKIENCPLLLMRPRAFNMIEHHCMINGRKVPGAFFDFALLMYHNGKILSKLEVGPYFYLSKIESAEEAFLWNKIFQWTQDRLNIPQGTIKACILIENILAVFEMEDILYAIKEHAIGLNCGIWDYSASIIQKFGSRREYLIPDRNKYVNVGQTFLKNYMQLVIRTCHKHDALATGGMAAKILPQNTKSEESLKIMNGVKEAKLAEIKMGVDGFMVYDLRVVPHINQLWAQYTSTPNQLHILPDISHITPESLLKIPDGGVTLEGLRHNLNVSLLFIYHWLSGQGVFYYNLSVEDSATAEISRSQLWQWLRHKAPIEGHVKHFIVHALIMSELRQEITKIKKALCNSEADKKRLNIAKRFLIEIITARQPPEFITTYLNDILHGKVGKWLVGKL